MLRKHDTAVLVTPIADWLPELPDADWIGIDAGYQTILARGYSCLFALGDFDSGELEDGLDFPAIQLPVAKDETDTQAALAKVSAMGYSTIYLVGAFGGRLDHTIANLRCMVWDYPQVIALEEKQRVSVLLPGRTKLKSLYRHVSFFAYEPSVITLEGFDYPLADRRIDQKDLYTCSNSISSAAGTVTLSSGRVLCVESNLR